MKCLNFLTLSVLAVASCMAFSACGNLEKDPSQEDGTEISTPVVVTGQASDVTDDSATASITITSDGGSAVTVCGIVWDEESNPTEDLPTKVTFDGTEKAYTCQLKDLNASTTYYYRAYAINEVGIAMAKNIHLQPALRQQ